MPSDLEALRTVLRVAADAVARGTGGPVTGPGCFRVLLYAEGCSLRASILSSLLAACVEIFDEGWIPLPMPHENLLTFAWRDRDDQTRGSIQVSIMDVLVQQLADPRPDWIVVMTHRRPNTDCSEAVHRAIQLFPGGELRFSGWRQLKSGPGAEWITDVDEFCGVDPVPNGRVDVAGAGLLPDSCVIA